MSAARLQRFVAAQDPETGRWYGRDRQATHPMAAQWWPTVEAARDEAPDFCVLHWIEWTATEIGGVR